MVAAADRGKPGFLERRPTATMSCRNGASTSAS